MAQRHEERPRHRFGLGPGDRPGVPGAGGVAPTGPTVAGWRRRRGLENMDVGGETPMKNIEIIYDFYDYMITYMTI